MDELKGIMKAVLEGQEALRAELQAFRQETNERLDRMDKRLDRLEQGQERQELILEKLAVRSIEQESRIDQIKKAK